jgi:putative addiction module component (TIGR02574 family)
MTIEQLEQQLLELPADERARLAKRLIESLDPESGDIDEAAIEHAWKVEIERRIEAMDRGEVEMIPAEAAIARIENASRCDTRRV